MAKSRSEMDVERRQTILSAIVGATAERENFIPCEGDETVDELLAEVYALMDEHQMRQEMEADTVAALGVKVRRKS